MEDVVLQMSHLSSLKRANIRPQFQFKVCTPKNIISAQVSN